MPCCSRPGRILAPVAALLAAGLAATGCSPGAQPAEASPAPRATIERGQRLLAQYQCGSCHAIPGVASAGGQVTSSLAGFGGRSYIAGRLPNQPDLLAQWIAKPQALVPGTLMPDMGVKPQDARDMAAYLLAQKP
ncbi:MAG: c-type cytochrome [Comamonadaceae bacterium]|nr:MAG: c-type cytochrome [Comamonadaceae bacterium]